MKRSNYKRKYRRRRYASKNKTAQIAKRAAVSVIRNMSEHKYYDTNTSGTEILNTGLSVWLTNVGSQGTSESAERIGDEIVPYSIFIRGYIQSRSTEFSTTVRLLIISDRNSNGTAPSFANVLQSVNLLSPINDTNKARFRILYDKFQTFSPGTGTAIRFFSFFRKLRKRIVYDSSNGPRDNHLYALFLSDKTTGYAPLMYANYRLRYIDP